MCVCVCVCVCCWRKRLFFSPFNFFSPRSEYLTAAPSDDYRNKVIADRAIRDLVLIHVQSVISLFERDGAKSLVHAQLY